MNEAGYELVVDDRFDLPQLDEDLWLPHHLPQWSSRSQARARYLVGHGLRLRIEEDQPPWCPELDGQVRVSSLQTGVFAGPLDSRIGQHRFNEDAVVREEQPAARLFTPRYGRFEMQARALADPRCMVALWMIGFEDEPERSAEICIAEIARHLRVPRRRAGRDLPEGVRGRLVPRVPTGLSSRLDAAVRPVLRDGRWGQ